MTQKAHASSTTEHPSPQRIMDKASAFYQSCVLFAATDLGVFREIDRSGALDVRSLALQCHADTRGMRLLLDACVAEGLLIKEGERYRNSADAAAFLVSGKPGDLSQALRYNRDVYRAWGSLAEMVQTGLPVEPPELHLGADPARTRDFVLSMHGRAMAIGQAVVPHLHIPRNARVLDIGAGSGAYSILVCRTHANARCTVLDLPPILNVAKELISQTPEADRIEMLPGDYHTTPFPAGQDVVTILGVLHQESPESIADILRRAAGCLNPGGSIYVLDMMTDDTRCNPPFSALFAVNMALTTENGWVFSDREITGWLRDAGFTNTTCRPLPPPMPHWLASARKG